MRLRSVGTLQNGCIQRIAEDGELQVKSPANMVGYYKDARATAEALKDGFLCTGDKAEMLSDGSVKIVGRTKDIFKTAKGKYIFPTEIEKIFAAAPYFDQVCVVGAGMSQPFMIAAASSLVAEVDHQIMVKDLKKRLDDLNSHLHAHEKISHLVVVKESWTVENGMMTPTLKIKRHALEAKYSQNFAHWTSSAESIVLI